MGLNDLCTRKHLCVVSYDEADELFNLVDLALKNHDTELNDSWTMHYEMRRTFPGFVLSRRFLSKEFAGTRGELVIYWTDGRRDKREAEQARVDNALTVLREATVLDRLSEA